MAHNLEQLTLDNLAQVKGGLVALMIEKALNRMATDIESAPDIPDWREVTLKIRAKPVLDQGELDDVAVEFVVNPKTPARVTSARMQVRSTTNGSRQLFFNIDSPDNPDQMTLLGEMARQENEAAQQSGDE